MFRFGFGISGLYKSEPTFFFVFGCLYLEIYCFSYSLISSCFAFRFALTYCLRVNVPKSASCFKSDDFFTPDFGCLYLDRYCFSYSLISSCFALRFALKCGLRVSLPRATSCCVQDVDFFTPDFGSYTVKDISARISFVLSSCLVLVLVFPVCINSELVLFCGFGCL